MFPRAAVQPWRALAAALRDPMHLGRDLARRIGDDDIMTHAAAMAYYFIFSLFPLVVVVLALTSVLPLPGLETWLLGNAASLIPSEAYKLVEGIIRALLSRPRGGALSIGALLALWSASSGVLAVMHGLARAYRVPDPDPWWKRRLEAMGLTLVLSLLMMVTFVLSIFGGSLVALVHHWFGPAAGVAAIVIRWATLLGAVTVLLWALAASSPATPRGWRGLTPGTAVFVVGFAGASEVFSRYVVAMSSYDATYGSLGAGIILLLWMYMLAVFLLIGAELNACLVAGVHDRR